MIELTGIETIFMVNMYGVKYFEILLAFSDDRKRRFEVTINNLKSMGTGITALNQTRKLRTWIMSEGGKRYFEEQVNKVS